MFWVYVLQCNDKSYYTGHTDAQQVSTAFSRLNIPKSIYLMTKFVDMDECVFLPIRLGNEILETAGISTCLCLMLYGHLSNHTAFIGMYHWAGFSRDAQSMGNDAEEVIDSLVAFLIDQARTQLKVGKRARLYLDSCFMIGGERRQTAPNGDLLLSGTEFEVNSLKKHFISLCKDYFYTTESTPFCTENYLTTAEQDITVTMNATHPTWVVEDPEQQMEPASDLDIRQNMYTC